MEGVDLSCDDLLKEVTDKIGTTEWITVFFISRGRKINEQKTFFCALINNDKVENSLNKYGWDINFNDSGRPGFVYYFKKGENVAEYFRHSTDEVEHLVYWRDFPGIDGRYLELSEEFRLFHNLYEKENKFYFYDDNGDKDLVVTLSKDEIRIKLKYLKKYLSARKMSLALFFEFMRFSEKSLKELSIKPLDTIINKEDLTYSKFIRDFDFMDTRKSQGWILGKKIIRGIKDYKPSIWESESNEYQDFIIGINDDGNEIYHTCDENYLANNFGQNPKSPHYLTPVYFKKDVLAKYYANPADYEVDDGIVRRIGFWTLRLDNNHPNYVVVFLGDLGKLHHNEQTYWKSFNVYSEDGLSKANWERSIEGKFSDPNEADLYFKFAYNRFQEKWIKKFGWHLFSPLENEDSHHFKTLHIPLNENQKEFDEQILSLTKLIIDSINEKKIKAEITVELKGSAKGIDKLQAFLSSNKLSLPNMIQFLRDLQTLRSSGSAHRKGSKYIKAKEKFNITGDNYINVFSAILKEAIKMFNTLEEYFIRLNATN